MEGRRAMPVRRLSLMILTLRIRDGSKGSLPAQSGGMELLW
ncbi:MAG: hypothetical protein SO147_05810 [Clostridia bacterium]|nr:hypothetical protein [Clostridia bacterium]